MAAGAGALVAQLELDGQNCRSSWSPATKRVSMKMIPGETAPMQTKMALRRPHQIRQSLSQPEDKAREADQGVEGDRNAEEGNETNDGESMETCHPTSARPTYSSVTTSVSARVVNRSALSTTGNYYLCEEHQPSRISSSYIQLYMEYQVLQFKTSNVTCENLLPSSEWSLR